jgi:hypothetical protein
MPEVINQSKHPRHHIGSHHKNIAKFRDAVARPVSTGSSHVVPGSESGSLLNRLRENEEPNTTKGKLIIAGIVVAVGLYLVFYSG